MSAAVIIVGLTEWLGPQADNNGKVRMMRMGGGQRPAGGRSASASHRGNVVMLLW